MRKIKQPLAYVWLCLFILVAGVLLHQQIKNPPKFNAGLLSTFQIDSASNNAALKLGERYQNKLLILVGSNNFNQAEKIAQKINLQLQQETWLISAYTNPVNINKLSQLIETYSEAPFTHLSEKYIEALQQNDNQPLTSHYFNLLNQWIDPVVSNALSFDATLSLASFLKEQLNPVGNWQVNKQQLFLKNGPTSYIPLFVTIDPDFLNMKDSVSVYNTLQNIKALYHLEADILMTGMLLHSASASLQAQSEITTFGALSLVAVLLIIFVAFRSFAPIAASAAVILSALLTGYLAVTLLFESIHLLAFVFAISIIGIAVDYGFHVLVLRQYEKLPTSKLRQKVLYPLSIALASTILGYSLFFITPIALLHQVVVFVCFGLLGAYLCALFALPEIPCHKTGSMLSVSTPKKLVFALLAFLTTLIALPFIEFDDNVANLNSTSAMLYQEEQKIAQLTGENVYPFTIVVNGQSKEALLQTASQLVTQLRAISSQSQQIKSISDWLLPVEQQQKNVHLFKTNWLSGKFNEIKSYVDETIIAEQLLTPRYLTKLPVNLTNDLGLGITVINETFWTSIQLRSPLTKEQEAVVLASSSAEFVNIPQSISLQLTKVRENIIAIALPATFLIAVMLSIFYGLKSGVVMTIVPLCCAGLALLISQIFQGGLNIFNILACLLIVTLSIDYCVFFRAHGHTKVISHTISLSALSSALTFGVLSISQTPAVSSFGLTLLIGISFAWGLSHLTPFTFTIDSTLDSDK